MGLRPGFCEISIELRRVILGLLSINKCSRLPECPTILLADRLMERPSIDGNGCAGSQRKAPRRAGRRRGSEMLEFTFALLPLLAMLTVLLDIAWAVYAQASVQRAVRMACRIGITLTNSQMAQGADLTSTVKSAVQTNGFGFLNGSTGLAYIKVNYYQPPAPSSSCGGDGCLHADERERTGQHHAGFGAGPPGESAAAADLLVEGRRIQHTAHHRLCGRRHRAIQRPAAHRDGALGEPYAPTQSQRRSGH